MTGTAYEHQKPDEKQVNVPHARVKLLSSKPPSREALIRNRKLRITGKLAILQIFSLMEPFYCRRKLYLGTRTVIFWGRHEVGG